MVKRKKETYLNKIVTINNFIKLLSGQYEYDDLEPDDPFGIKTEIKVKLSDEQKRLYRQYSNKIEGQLLKDVDDISVLFPKHVLLKDVEYYQPGSENNGPPIRTTELYYRLSDLIDWMHENYECDIELPDWINNYLINKYPDTNMEKYDKKTVDVTSLPKILQLMIETCFDKETKYNSKKYEQLGSRQYQEEVGTILNEKAKKMGIKMAQEKHEFGLGDINIQKIIQFTRPDED